MKLQILNGNVWALAKPTDYVVIPTNIGWKTNGCNVMGRGLAQQAARLCPELPERYGEYCQLARENTAVVIMNKRYILFPTKPLHIERPYFSWKFCSSLELIERSLKELVEILPVLPKNRRVLITDVGCGNGGLSIADVRPLLEKYLWPFPSIRLVILE